MSSHVTGSDNSKAIGLIGFGEAAQAFSQGWKSAIDSDIAAFDIKTLSAGDARDAKLADYRRMDIRGCETLAGMLADAGIVFSLVTADSALEAARSAAEAIAPGLLYLDCNSCAPDTKRNAAKLIDGSGGRYVDAAVMSPVHPNLHRTPILLSGPDAAAALTHANEFDMNAEIAGDEVGRASSIKLVRSIMIKGLEALCAECLLTGRKLGVEDTVLQTLDASFPGFDWKSRAANMLERMVVHGERRAAEMDEAAAMIGDAGLPNQIAKATSEWQRRIGELRLPPEKEADFEQIADALLDRGGWR